MTAFGVLTATAAIGSSLVGGVFLAFSGFVMPALQRLPTASGVAAMQSINVTAVGAPLMTALFGTAAAVAVPIVAWRAGSGRTTLVLVCLAAGCYLLGTVGTTIATNVPLNDRLAAATTALPADAWTGWVTAWTRHNHVRTVAALAAAALYTAALPRPAS